jgi:hypothetical protein
MPLLVDLLPEGRGLLVMLKVYIDKGERQDTKLHDGDDVMSVAAVVYKAEPYKKFVRPWNQMLRGWGVKAFHATDFYTGYPPFQRETVEQKARFERDSKRIPSLVGRYIQRVTVVAFRPNEFAECASPRWKERFGIETHSIAVQLAMFNLGVWREQNCPHEEFAYFHESAGKGDGMVCDGAERMRADEAYSKVLKATSFTMIDKGKARGLEAADFVSWHWNKHFLDKLKLGDDVPRKDFSAFIQCTENKVSHAFVTGQKLETFFRVCDLERPVPVKVV